MTLLDGREYEVQYRRLTDDRWHWWSRYLYLEMAIAVAERLRDEGLRAQVIAAPSMSNGGNRNA